MTLPALDKTYDYTYAQQRLAATGVLLSDARQAMLKVKNTFLDLGWTVKGSCGYNGSWAAGMDGVDRWTTDTSLVWDQGAVVISWIVFVHPTIANLEILLSLESASTTANAYPNTATIVLGTSFSGGTTTARPTSTVSVNLIYRAAWINRPYNAVWGDLIISGIKSTDSDVMRLFIHWTNTCVMYVDISAIKSPRTGHTHPYYAFWQGTTGPTYANIYNLAPTKTFQNTTAVNLYYSTLMFGAKAYGQQVTVAHPKTGEWPLTSCAFVSNDVGYKGRFGRIYDVYFTSITRIEGDTYPNDTTRLWRQIGNIAIPWNGSELIIA